MRYELQSRSIGAKINVFAIDNIAEKRNKDGEITTPATTIETKTDKHSYPIVLTLVDTESLNTSSFNIPISVEVNETLTGKEVEETIEISITEYLKQINQ